MPENIRIIIGIAIVITVYILTRKYHAWRIKRTYVLIIDDLRQREALDPFSAVELPYAKMSIYRVGIRDYRPKAVQHLVLGNIIGTTESGKYYLLDKNVNLHTLE